MSTREGLLLSFLMGLLFIVVLQRILKGKTQKPSSPMLTGHGKGENIVLSPFNFSRNEKGEGKADVTGRESFVFQRFIVLELLSSQHDFFMHFPYRYIKWQWAFQYLICPGGQRAKKKSRSLPWFLHGWGYSYIGQFVHIGKTEEKQQQVCRWVNKKVREQQVRRFTET